MNRRPSRSGVTLLEMIVVVAILAIILAASYETLMATTRAERTGTAISKLQDECRTVLDMMSLNLRSTQASTVSSQSLLGDDNDPYVLVTIPNVTGYDADLASLTYGTPTYYVAMIGMGETYNGEDDDADGLVDEYDLILLEDTDDTTNGTPAYPFDEIGLDLDDADPTNDFHARTISSHLTGDTGIVLTINADMFTITLVLQCTDAAGRVVQQPMTTTVWCRN